MDPQQEIPKRSNLWFAKRHHGSLEGKLLDKTTAIFTGFLTAFSFTILWPLISKINFGEVFQTPLIPFLLFVFSGFGARPELSIRIIFIVSFVAAAGGLYLLVRELTKRQMSAILAAAIFIAPPIPVFVLTYLTRGLSVFELESARSFLTITYGDGGLLALALIPFTTIFFLRYLKKGEVGDYLWAVFLAAGVFLTNGSQGLALLLVFGAVFLTELFLTQPRTKIKRSVEVILPSLGLVAFWFLPSFVSSPSSFFTSSAFANLKFLFPLPFILFVLGLLFSFVFFGRKEKRQAIFAFFLLFSVFFGLTFDWLFGGHSYVVHPYRLIPELNMFGSVVAALAVSALLDKLRIVEKLEMDNWSQAAQIFTSLIFGVGSFLGFVLIAYVFAPTIILAISGPFGVWTKIRLNALADRQAGLTLGIENFKLAAPRAEDWHLIAGFVFSALFVLFLAVVIFKKVRYEANE